jgi:hypothetical protein
MQYRHERPHELNAQAVSLLARRPSWRSADWVDTVTPMANLGARAATLLDVAPRGLVWGLLAARVLTLALVITDANRNPVTDVDVGRAERIATSPARPYRDFSVEYMPLETAVIEIVAGDGPPATATRLAVLAFVGDVAVAAALAHGWGRRPAVMYLLLGLPLLTFMYQRFDPVAVAMTAWAFALSARRRDIASGMMLGLAVLAKLWPIVLVPALWIRRRSVALAAGAAVGLIGGAWWYLWGGPKGPLQVLTFRGAVGWSVESTVGNVIWIASGGQGSLEAGAIRIGVAPTWAKGLLLLGLIATETILWVRARQDRDLAGGTALAAVSALLVFSPLFSIQYSAWLLPWAAIAFDGDPEERRVATLSAAVIAMCGVLSLSYQSAAPATDVLEKWLLLIRNATCIGVVALWITRPRAGSAPQGRIIRAARVTV